MHESSREPLTITFTGREAETIRNAIHWFKKWNGGYGEQTEEFFLSEGVYQMVCKWACREGIASQVIAEPEFEGE